MGAMHSPPHPGAVIREYLGEMSVTETAARLHVNRATLSRLLNGTAGISADMAIRLGEAFGTSAEMWAGMQMQHDLWLAEKADRPKIGRIPPS